jgi:hypothetical protein
MVRPMRVDELDYSLPEALIATEPLPHRDAARLLCPQFACVVAATAVLLEPLVHCRSTHSQGRGNSCWGPPSLKQLNCSKSTALLDPTI